MKRAKVLIILCAKQIVLALFFGPVVLFIFAGLTIKLTRPSNEIGFSRPFQRQNFNGGCPYTYIHIPSIPEVINEPADYINFRNIIIKNPTYWKTVPGNKQN